MFEGLFQPMHLLFIMGIALIFFGPSKLPGLGKGLGESMRNFREAMRDGMRDEPPAQLPAVKVSDKPEV